MIFAFQSQAPQRLGVQASQFGVDSLPAVDVAQQSLELQAGAQTGRRAGLRGRERHAELGGGGAGHARPAMDAQTPVTLERLVQRPRPRGSAQRGVTALQRLVGGEQGPRVNGAGR